MKFIFVFILVTLTTSLWSFPKGVWVFVDEGQNLFFDLSPSVMQGKAKAPISLPPAPQGYQECPIMLPVMPIGDRRQKLRFFVNFSMEKQLQVGPDFKNDAVLFNLRVDWAGAHGSGSKKLAVKSSVMELEWLFKTADNNTVYLATVEYPPSDRKMFESHSSDVLNLPGPFNYQEIRLAVCNIVEHSSFTLHSIHIKGEAKE